MTELGALPPLPDSVLRSWPGRFRSSHVMAWLYPADDDGQQDLTAVMLAAVAAGQDENAALAGLIADGEFDVAELMLSQCSSIDSRTAKQAAKNIESGRCEAISKLSDRMNGLQELADAADVSFDPATQDLERLAYRSRKAAARLLDKQEENLNTVIDKQVKNIRERLPAAELTAETLRMVNSLLDSKRVRAAAQALENGTLDMPGPESQPPLPPWPWSEAPVEVLSWHLDRNTPRPLPFSAQESSDAAAQRFFQALDEVNNGQSGAAKSFVVAFEELFCSAQAGPVALPPVVHAIPGGFLTSVSNVFAADPLAVFHPTGRIPLFVGEPGLGVPPELGEVGHFIAVGPQLDAGGRGLCAVLTLRDLLRLADVPFRRDISLARVIGRQWSLAGLGAGSAAELATLMGQSAERRWQTLCWLADLTGLGGTAMADALRFHSGDDPGVLYVLLEFLLAQESRQQETARQRRARPSVIGTLHTWSDDKQTADKVEAEVLRDCRPPAARAAFWSAIAAAPPGTGLSLNALVLAASFLEKDVDWGIPLNEGFDSLGRQWVAEITEQNTVSLRRMGVTIGLRRLAEQRLGELADELRGSRPQTGTHSGVVDWTAYRFALSPGWPVYRALRESGTAAGEELAEARTSLEVPVATLIAESATLPGQTDLMAVLGELCGVLRVQYPGVTVEIDGPAAAAVAISERSALSLLYELVQNSVEAMDGVGSIGVQVRPAGLDVIVDIRDTGDGLAAEIDNAFRMYRQGYSTRGPGRGQGLFLVRQLSQQAGGDIELVSRAAQHPVLRGAHFCLVLPRGRLEDDGSPSA